MLISNAHAWTLVNSGLSGFQTSPNINIYMASNTCTNAGITPAQMENLIKEAISTYWNSIPSSSLTLSFIGTKSVDASAMDLNALINGNVTNNQIVVGCSASGTFGATTLAVGSMGCLSNTDCRGGVLINDTASTPFKNVSYDVQKSTFAHELGHALGLGHTSVEEALMYYDASNRNKKKLNQDDIDAATYLYPNQKKLSGLAGACGTIESETNSKNNFLGSILFGVLITTALFFLINRRKFNNTI